MFRVMCSGVQREKMEQIAGRSWVKTEPAGKRDDGSAGSEYYVFVRDHRLKAEYRATGLVGRGIAILGLDGFDPVSNTLTVAFDTTQDARMFKAWLCGSGEQYFWMWDDEHDEDLPHRRIQFDYHDPGGSVIVATRNPNRDRFPPCTCTGPASDAHDLDCPVRIAYPRYDLGD